MARLTLTLLGSFQARVDDRAVGVSTKKGQALLAYLAMPAGKVHPRDKLATLLWGDLGDVPARAGLRQVLFTLRRILGDPNPLGLDGETVALDPDGVDTDVGEFQRCAARGTLADLQRAAALYRGDLLQGFLVQEPSFEEWLVAERRRLHEQAIETLGRLVAQQRDAGALEPAVETALRIVALDPVQEPAHRILMRLHAQLGRRGAALRQYQLCVTALQRELRAEPDAETKALYRDILQRRVVPTSAVAPRSVAPPPTPAAPAMDADVPAWDSPLVGRDVELRFLEQSLQSASAGRAHLISVVGEAGIGKSRLVAELAGIAARQGVRVLHGGCHESEQVLPYGPWLDALRADGVASDLRLLKALGGPWRSELARLLPEISEAPLGPPTADAFQLFEAVARVLERLSLAQPILFVLEDLHGADEISLRLLTFVGRRARQSRVLGVVTARAEDVPLAPVIRCKLDELEQDGHLVRCELGPLGREDTEALGRALVGPGDVELADDRLWRATQGNPFMIVETLRAMRGGHAREAPVTLPIPERVRRLIAHRVERLGEPSRRLAAVAAVIGRPFEWALLERAANLGNADTAEGMEELVRHRILRGADEIFEFTHDRMRDVVYGSILPALRARLHRGVADAIEHLHRGDLDRHMSALAVPYREGQVWEKAVHYLQEAALQASMRYAQRDSVACYQQAVAALAHLPSTPETQAQGIDLRFRVAFSLYGLREGARALQGLREAEALGVALGDQRRLGEVYVAMTHGLAT